MLTIILNSERWSVKPVHGLSRACFDSIHNAAGSRSSGPPGSSAPASRTADAHAAVHARRTQGNDGNLPARSRPDRPAIPAPRPSSRSFLPLPGRIAISPTKAIGMVRDNRNDTLRIPAGKSPVFPLDRPGQPTGLPRQSLPDGVSRAGVFGNAKHGTGKGKTGLRSNPPRSRIQFRPKRYRR